MSWYGNTVLVMVEDAFSPEEDDIPKTSDEAASRIKQKWSADREAAKVADYISSLGDKEFEQLLFDAKLLAVNTDPGCPDYAPDFVDWDEV